MLSAMGSNVYVRRNMLTQLTAATTCVKNMHMLLDMSLFMGVAGKTFLK